MTHFEHTDWTVLWRRAAEALMKARRQSSRLGEVRELIGERIRLTLPLNNFVLSPRRAPNPTYACGELVWFMSGERKCEWMHPYAPSYQERYGEPDGTSYGGYGVRMEGTRALDEVVDLLDRKPDSRHAAIQLWRQSDLTNGGAKRDVPCCFTLHFLLRDGALDLVVSWRSNDVWLGMPYDVFAVSCMQAIAAASLGASIGRLTYNVGSLHLYERYADRAAEALAEPTALLSHGWESLTTTLECRTLVTLEAVARRGEWNWKDAERWAGLSAMGRDVLACALRAHGLALPIQSPLLKRAMDHYDAHTRRRGLDGEDHAGEETAGAQPAQD